MAPCAQALENVEKLPKLSQKDRDILLVFDIFWLKCVLKAVVAGTGLKNIHVNNDLR